MGTPKVKKPKTPKSQLPPLWNHAFSPQMSVTGNHHQQSLEDEEHGHQSPLFLLKKDVMDGGGLPRLAQACPG